MQKSKIRDSFGPMEPENKIGLSKSSRTLQDENLRWYSLKKHVVLSKIHAKIENPESKQFCKVSMSKTIIGNFLMKLNGANRKDRIARINSILSIWLHCLIT